MTSPHPKLVIKNQREASSSQYRAYTHHHLDQISYITHLPKEERQVMQAVAAVFPFRTNSYVLDNLIDWNAIPHDPIYQLVFPQRGMLAPSDLAIMLDLVSKGASQASIEEAVHGIRLRLNPHPAGQLDLNVPRLEGKPLHGLQHKYPETVLFFPSHGQTCHAYCTYCFRWPQFIGDPTLKIVAREAENLYDYLRQHPEVTDVLITGGDPLIMKTSILERYIEPLLHPSLETIQTIRIGTKSVAYWPQRFVTDDDADDLLRLFERVGQSGKQLALMAHYSHPHELEPTIAREAIRRIHSADVIMRAQAPLIRHINDSASIWADLWRSEVQLGVIPYYMFVERDTGPKNYFEVPLAQAYNIFRDAYAQVSGLARTVRGPSMSSTPGKIAIDGVIELGDEQVFVLHFIQARNPTWVGRPFFARFNPTATWLTDLTPAFGQERFFFEQEGELLRSSYP